MRLEDEQKILLVHFVEAHRNAPPDKRAPFATSNPVSESQTTFIHLRVPALRFKGSREDADVLAGYGLLQVSWSSKGDPLYYVTPKGIEQYEELMQSSPAVDSVEEQVRRYLSSDEFRSRHPAAFAKWEAAAALLWRADSNDQLTTIGHLCRESLQEFVASLARRQGVKVAESDPAKTVARLRAILAAKATSLGSREAPFLDALLSYWGTVSDLVQRQEHGALREAEPLTWEDGRRVVFQSCVLMYEVSRALE